ncbi:transposase, IS4 family protein [Caballeronia fortuita]|uniref:Transposase, IS4 family protein n=1 Tax=Caballeronia fortuita TaxID=1777138 RepID=A0A158CBW5_9BURK|nr:transposase, IS4 family protein [Caballeronia fortuita]
MGWVIPSSKLALMEPHYLKRSTARAPIGGATMLQIHFIQWFGVSDPAMAESVSDVPLYLGFAGLVAT